MWQPCDNGKTINTIGSENGLIIKDEKHTDGARITLEKDGNTPFAITCGIYGVMVHTVFAPNYVEAAEKYQAMKEEIACFLLDEDEDLDDDWCSRFVDMF